MHAWCPQHVYQRPTSKVPLLTVSYLLVHIFLQCSAIILWDTLHIQHIVDVVPLAMVIMNMVPKPL